MFTRSDRCDQCCFVFMVHMLGYIRVLENFPRCSYDPRPTTDRGVPDMTSSIRVLLPRYLKLADSLVLVRCWLLLVEQHKAFFVVEVQYSISLDFG